MRHPLSAHSITHRIRRRLLGAPSLEAAANEVRVVCPAEQGERGAALYLPGQLDRVRGVPPESAFEREFSRIAPGPVVHQACLAFRFAEAFFVDGAVFANGTRTRQAVQCESLLPQLVPHREAYAALPSSFAGSRFFGHYVADNLCTGLLAQEFGPVFWANSEVMGPHASRYLDLLRLPSRSLERARVGEAWLFQDVAMNSHRRGRLHAMRDRVRSGPADHGGHGVFFRRRGGGAPRNLANEEAIEERLAAEGFEIVDVTRESLDTILRRCRNAAVVAGVEGSALVHGLLAMAEGGALVCIDPPYRFANIFKDHSDALGLTYAFAVAEGSASSFELDADELLRTIELARNHAARRRTA